MSDENDVVVIRRFIPVPRERVMAAWLDPKSGKVFCLSSGPNKEAIMKIHERAGHPTAEVYELPIEV